MLLLYVLYKFVFEFGPFESRMENVSSLLNALLFRRLLTIRDLLSWITFINKTARVAKATDAMETDPVELDVSTAHRLDPAVSYVHGAFLVFVDCLVGSGEYSYFI